MFISNATGCSSIWGGTAAVSPYTVNKASGHGPAWNNSLFEDNAEHGFGLYLGQKTIRENTLKLVAEMAADEKATAEFKAAYEEFMKTKDNTMANIEPAKALIAEIEKAAAAGCPIAPEVLANKQYLAKKSCWIFGGDGWAYDIGYGGLDHVIASGEDVNILVLDTEVYSNTGGQASKSTPTGSVAKFAAGGKLTKKKDLGKIAMTYEYVYVAECSMGADKAQFVKAISEAEAYHGPSLIICYAPCINHGINMSKSQNEEKLAVESGYWQLYRYNPSLIEKGQNPFSLDSKKPTGDYQAFLMGENRYAQLAKAKPEVAKELFARNEKEARIRYEEYSEMAKHE